MINWIIDFLSGRSQRIKLAECLFRYYHRKCEVCFKFLSYVLGTLLTILTFIL